MTLMETNTAMNRNDAAGDPLAVARSVLLEPHGLDVKDLNGAIGRIFEHKVDYADLYFQYTRSEGWSLDEGIVKSGSFAIEQGVGVRAVSGDRSAFAYSDEINAQALMSAADATRTIARSGRSGRTRVGDAQAAPARRRGRRKAPRLLYGMDDPIASMEAAGKVGLLQRIEAYARRKDPRVTQVMAGLAAEHDVVMVMRSDGVLAADVRPLVRVSVQVIVEQNGRREQGHAGGGGRFDLDYFSDERVFAYVDEAVRQALVNLEARPAPGGVLSVVLGPGWPGVLLHEAVGHGLEGDFNRKKSSVFSGRIGERVAAKGVTVLDDGTLPDRRGSLNIDDEGNPTQRNVLIEDGVLKGYLQDSLNARLMKVPVTGNGRRESFAHLPMPRMTNTRAGRDSGVAGARAVCRELRGRSGGHHQWQVRVLGVGSLLGGERQDPVSGEGGHHHRQRAGCADAGDDDRQRHESGSGHRCLRQGWPERAGGGGAAHAAHRGADRGRNGLMGAGPVL